MDLNNYALTLLCGNNLEDKLLSQEGLNFFEESPSLKNLPILPGRPQSLSISKDTPSLKRPSLKQLEQSSCRAQLLHAFLNHELQAIELMALALLKFPNEPITFRRGLLKTIREEQTHLMLYHKRLNELGYTIGDFPVNGFFWNRLKNMKSPQEYTTGMALCFEQANLDYAQAYSNDFKTIDDIKSHHILEKVLEDEIQHVAFGWRWFKKFQPDQTPTFSSFESSLIFPFSPAWAKGQVLQSEFNIDARKRSGLPDDFILDLKHLSHSRGRPPNIYMTNILSEDRTASPNRNFPKNLLHLESDLDFLLAVFTKKEDLYLTERPPSSSFLELWRSAGWAIPHCIPPAMPLPKGLHKFGQFIPWGWDPLAQKHLQKLYASYSHQQSNKVSDPSKPMFWHSRSRCLEIKKALEHDLLRYEKLKAIYKPLPMIICQNLADLKELPKILGTDSKQNILFKPLISQSGRGQIRLPLNEIQNYFNQDPQKDLLTNGYQCEQELSRLVDFSLLMKMDRGQLKFLGISRNHVTTNGQWKSNTCGSVWNELDSKVLSYLFPQSSQHIGKLFFQCIYKPFESLLKEWNYEGLLGLDQFLYTQDDQVYYHPFVDLNLRTTMGHIVLAWAKRCSPKKKVELKLINFKKLGFTSAKEWFNTQDQVEFDSAPRSGKNQKIKSGTIALKDPLTAYQTLPVLIVSN